jgi:hypothetical protein
MSAVPPLGLPATPVAFDVSSQKKLISFYDRRSAERSLIEITQPACACAPFPASLFTLHCCGLVALVRETIRLLDMIVDDGRFRRGRRRQRFHECDDLPALRFW